MIILDTNVVSEPLRPAPDPAVLAWLDRQAPESLYLTTINLAELLAGIELLPAGKRRTDLKLALLGRMLPLFDQRLLSFDSSAAKAFAQINALAQAAGSPVSFADGTIAAIAAARGFMIATRNVRDFSGTGVKLVNPWTD